ncbi:hypothetical protein PUN28_003398 [Cardiocondyla obscurior]|uniref:Uncharacterized protein n=1 Tax=Cardiocondyla obscurior TaxID=286306 RepID=A0AAW2GMZ2_9HYME
MSTYSPREADGPRSRSAAGRRVLDRGRASIVGKGIKGTLIVAAGEQWRHRNYRYTPGSRAAASARTRRDPDISIRLGHTCALLKIRQAEIICFSLVIRRACVSKLLHPPPLDLDGKVGHTEKDAP